VACVVTLLILGYMFLYMFREYEHGRLVPPCELDQWGVCTTYLRGSPKFVVMDELS
jgi:hypothetical protein